MLYLKNPDDKPATISIEEQQRKIVRATVDFLKQFEENACPVINLFGSKDPRTMTIARFRDEILMKSSAGRSIIACYEKNGAKAIEIFEKHPIIKSSARKGTGGTPAGHGAYIMIKRTFHLKRIL